MSGGGLWKKTKLPRQEKGFALCAPIRWLSASAAPSAVMIARLTQASRTALFAAQFPKKAEARREAYFVCTPFRRRQDGILKQLVKSSLLLL